MSDRAIGVAEDGSQVSEYNATDLAIADAVRRALAETFDPSPPENRPGFPVYDFMVAVIHAADEFGVELSRDDLEELLRMAVRRHTGMVMGGWIRDAIGRPFRGPDRDPPVLVTTP